MKPTGLTEDEREQLQALSSDTYQIDLKQGEEVLLYPGAESLPASEKPLPAHSSRNQ
jgi:hypothetical protein